MIGHQHAIKVTGFGQQSQGPGLDHVIGLGGHHAAGQGGGPIEGDRFDIAVLTDTRQHAAHHPQIAIAHLLG